MLCINCQTKKTKSSHHKFCSKKCKEDWERNKVYVDIENLPEYPTYDQILTKDWRDWVCTADWHLPFVSKTLFAQMIRDSKERGLKKLLVGGDFLDLNCFSKFFCHHRTTWKEEKLFARKVVEILKENFEEIVFMASNHEIRYLRNMLNPCGEIDDLYTVIGVDNQVYDVTLQNKVVVDNYIIMHPKNARKNQLSLARDMSNIYKDKHIVVTHAHMQSQAIDPSGEHWLIDLGLMGDSSKIEYKNFNITCHYQWNSGYILIEDGHPTLKWDESRIKR